MAYIVHSFNSLPSDPTTSHWHFAVRHLPTNTPRDLIHLVQPFSRFSHVTRSRQILSLPTRAAQADIIVPLLLESFVNGLIKGPNGEPPGLSFFAPCSWSISDRALAPSIEAKLHTLGVRADLCTIQAGSPEDNKIADEIWLKIIQKIFEKLRKTGEENIGGAKVWWTRDRDRLICNGCRKDSSWVSGGLQKCANCLTVRYCSRECEKEDWKQHQKVCGKETDASNNEQVSSTYAYASASTDTRTRIHAVDVFQYYYGLAHKNPEANALATSIGLALPPRRGGLNIPIRRLILTGKDTPENLMLLLGPGWRSEEKKRGEVRIEILLAPPPGSPAWAMSKKLDDGALVITPRTANAEEAARIQEVKDMQAIIRSHLGWRERPTSQDMQIILTANYADDWEEKIPTYILAINTMDQGVGVSGLGGDTQQRTRTTALLVSD